MIHSRDAMANPCCCICGQIQLKYLCCTWSWLAVMESLTESFTMAFLERAKVEERERFPERYCLENTLLHQLFDFRVLPAKQAQRIRCGGTAIYISKDLTSGQYMKFTQIEKKGLWDDDQVQGIYVNVSGRYPLAIVVLPVQPSGMLVFGTHLEGGNLVLTSSVSGAMFLEVPYKPRQKVWDLLTEILKMLDLHMPTYRSKVLKLVVGVEAVEEGHWVENLSKLWGPLPRASLKAPAEEQHGGEPSHQHGEEPSHQHEGELSLQGMKRPAACR